MGPWENVAASVSTAFEYTDRILQLTATDLLNRDFAVVTAAVVLFAAMYTFANLMADLAYGWVNPTVRLN